MKIPYSRFVVIAPAVVLLLVGVASVAFAWGASSAGPAAAPSHLQRPSGMPGNPGLGATTQAPVIGVVASKADTAIVVTTTAGKTVTVNVSPATQYSVRGVASPTLANITVGERIVVQGTLNADGSLNATLVQVGVSGGLGGGNGGFGGGSGRGRRGSIPSPVPSGPTT